MAKLFSLLFFLLSQNLVADSLFPIPQDVRATRIYWLTAGLGQGIESRYGHSILRIEDIESGKEYNFNWGVFDFSDPLLPLNFVRAKLLYWADNQSLRSILQVYRARPLFIQEVHLSDTQKGRFFAILHRQLTPEHIHFWYHHFFKNCATIPLEYLNEALGGKLKERFVQRPSGKTFRYYVLRNLAEPMPVAFALNILMNSKIDYEISQWEEMFYPPKILEYLAQTPAYDDHLEPMPNQMLFSEAKEVLGRDEGMEAQLGEVVDLNPYVMSFFLVLLALSLSLIFWGKGMVARVGRWFLGATISLWGIFSCAFGLSMAIIWAFSHHLDGHHNWNLMLFWPLDFFLCLALFRSQVSKFERIYLWLHVLGVVVYAFVGLTGLTTQVVHSIVYQLAPIQLLCLLLRLWTGTAPRFYKSAS